MEEKLVFVQSGRCLGHAAGELMVEADAIMAFWGYLERHMDWQEIEVHGSRAGRGD